MDYLGGVAVTDVTGKIVRESTGTDDYKADLKKLAERRDTVSKGKQIEQPKIRNVGFSDAADEYLKEAKLQRAYKNKECMKNGLIEGFGNTSLRRFNVSVLDAYHQDLLAEGTAPGTIN